MIEGLVSVVIPTYKRSDMLPRAIQSVLSQTYKDIEILIVDDNTPGDAFSNKVKELVGSYNNERIRYIGQAEHVNGAKARNEGIKASNGEYIAFLDDDDEWKEDKITKQINLMNDNPECGGCSCLYEIFSGDLCIRKHKSYSGEDLQYKVFSREVAVCTPTVIVKKNVLDKCRCFDINLKRHQDLQFLIDVLSCTKMCVLNEYCVIVHDDSTMNRPDSTKIIDMKKAFFESVKEHYVKYTKKEKKMIRNAHIFEIVLMSLRERKILRAVKYTLKIGISPSSYLMLYKRYKERK